MHLFRSQLEMHTEADEVTSNNQRPTDINILSFKMMPKTLLDPAIQKDPPDKQAREKLFRNIIQYRNWSAWKEEHICPQLYLDCEISDDKHNILLNMSTS